MKSMIEKCWPSAKLSKTGAISSKVWTLHLKSGPIMPISNIGALLSISRAAKRGGLCSWQISISS